MMVRTMTISTSVKPEEVFEFRISNFEFFWGLDAVMLVS